ncbi:MAG: phosphoribosylanthranilate isomerase, partial [Leptolyngbyaceae cyanobacterium SL_7_1]|nr:phosphoribosylanthranilate isomerase [Leptolyngbyaceae cyanobacterium SL_7_1]
LGFMCFPGSPRYAAVTQIQAIVEALPDREAIDRVGVFVDAPLDEIVEVVAIADLNAVQLHGTESVEFCQQLRDRLPGVELIKAFRVRSMETLNQVNGYAAAVDTFLLDAYHPQQWGGTGQTLDWSLLEPFRPDRPWLLAGGIHPHNVLQALNQAHPDGIDLSSGVERTPGDKDLEKVAQLFEQLVGW